MRDPEMLFEVEADGSLNPSTGAPGGPRSGSSKRINDVLYHPEHMRNLFLETE